MELHGIQFDEAKLAEFCQRNGITHLSLFGSILTDRFGPDSDVDLLVEFDPERQVGLFEVGGMTMDLIDMLGRDVDLRTAEDLSVYFREDVVRNARLLYAAGLTPA
jgi:predicted nucleotidyltransferase